MEEPGLQVGPLRAWLFGRAGKPDKGCQRNSCKGPVGLRLFLPRRVRSSVKKLVPPCSCRLAQAVLAREDPQEVFLKSIPSDPVDVEVIYPVSTGHGGLQLAGGCWTDPLCLPK